MGKKITTISIDEIVLQNGREYAIRHKYRSFSTLVEDLVQKELEREEANGQ